MFVDDVVVLGSGPVWTHKYLPTFRRNILPGSAGLENIIFISIAVSTSYFT
jgi:hypothetical protein